MTDENSEYQLPDGSDSSEDSEGSSTPEPTEPNEPTNDIDKLFEPIDEDRLSLLPPEVQNAARKQIADYQKAYAEEFAQSVAEGTKKATESALDIFVKDAVTAAERIVWLAASASSHSTKLAANKYILDSLRRGYVDSPDNPIGEIIKGIMAGNTIPE